MEQGNMNFADSTVDATDMAVRKMSGMSGSSSGSQGRFQIKNGAAKSEDEKKKQSTNENMPYPNEFLQEQLADAIPPQQIVPHLMREISVSRGAHMSHMWIVEKGGLHRNPQEELNLEDQEEKFSSCPGKTDWKLIHPRLFTNMSLKEEFAPLVSTTDADGREIKPCRLVNPTTDFEGESQEPSSSKLHRTSNFQTMMHLLKGNIGTGILAMPNAIKNAGLLVGSIGIPVLGIICVHCMHLLVISSKSVARRIGHSSLDYASTAEYAFQLGPPRLQFLSKVARTSVNTMLMLTQFGFCCVYFLFVSSSIVQVVKFFTNNEEPIGVVGYMAILLPFMIIFNFIRSLKHLSYASSIANVLQILGLCFVFYYLLRDITDSQVPPLTAPLSKLPLYFGTAMYAFEGIGVILPLENAMETPEDFGGLTGVLNTGMVIVACLYTAVGFYGYLRYGTMVKSSITFNLDPEPFSEAIRLMFALSIFLSYALQLYVPLQIIWPWMKKKFRLETKFSSSLQLIFEYALRAFLVIITFSLAALIPELDLFISLVGALASSSLALIFPPILELVTKWNSKISQEWLFFLVVKNVCIILFGTIGCISGTYVTVSEIVKAFRSRSS